MSKIVMYSKVPCPYCVAAENLLQSLDLEYQKIDLTGQQDEIDRIKQKTGWRTVPIILINDQLVGGYTDLKALVDENKLDSLLGK